MSAWPIFEGGGGEAPSRRSRERARKRYVEAEICRRLGLPYYGFLLYHSGHKRLRSFLDNHLTFFDQVTGSDFGIFILADKHKHPLKIDEILAKESLDEDLRTKIERWREHTRPFTPDKCFEIAEALNIPRADLPCLIIFRSANGYRPFARLKLKNSWFPESAEDEKTLSETMEWLSKLFDSLQRCMSGKKKKDAIKAFQKEMGKLARSQNIYRPVFNGLKDNFVPIAKLPFDIVSSLSSIVRKVGTSIVRRKVEAVLEGED